MSVRITHTEASLYDSTTGIAFGPVFDSAQDASDFVEWLEFVRPGRDARLFTSEALVLLKDDWQDERDDVDRRDEDGPSDDEIYNRAGVEGGIAYDTTADEPGSLGRHDWRL